MTSGFRCVEDPGESHWRELCATAPANPFLTPAYAEARRRLGAEPRIFALADEGAVCVGFLRRGRIGGRLELPSAPSIPQGAGFWEGLLEHCRASGIRDLELNSFAGSEGALPRLPGERRRRARREYVLDLRRPEPWKERSSNHSRNIKRGRKAGLAVRRDRGDAACAEHARLIGASLSRRRQRDEQVPEGSALPDVRAFVDSGAGALFQALDGESVLSSVLVLEAERGGYYQSAGTSPEGMARGASHFLIHEIAERLRGEGRECFNLGGADGAGLARFKAGFGTGLRELEAAELFVGSSLQRILGWAARQLRRNG